MLGIPQEDPRWVFWRAATAVPGTWDIPPVRRHSIRDRYKTWEILGELLGGLEHIGNVIIPNDELIFFRGVAQPPTRNLMNAGLNLDGPHDANSFKTSPALSVKALSWLSDVCAWCLLPVIGLDPSKHVARLP